MDWKISKQIAVVCFTLVVCCTYSLVGQGLAVNSFVPLPNDMEAQTLSPVRDANGNLAALIKVVTTETGFNFTGGSLGIVATEQNPGEIWVYIPPGARTLTIRHPQLGVIRNYTYPEAIASGRVYEMELVHGVVETIVREHKILSEFVIINSQPSGADVYLNNEAVGKTPFSADKPEGSYEWRLEHNLYQPEAGVFELKAGEKVKLDIPLKPDFGTLEITSKPEQGASISLNGMKLGKSTPDRLEEVPTGEHTLTLLHDLYETTSQKVTIKAGETESITIAMKPTFAELTVETIPGAEVLVNGESKSTGNWQGRLISGVYELEVRKQGHHPASKQLEIKVGDKETIALSPTPILSDLKVTSEPMDAEIYLNGERYGTTPHIVRDLLIGDYELELRKNGFASVSKQVEVIEGEVAEVNIQLKGVAESTEVKIGKQVWMAENLNVDKFRNGDPIRHAKTAAAWKRAKENKEPAWCYYENSTANGDKYGKLYNWFAVNDPRGLAPVGWHIPSDKEWTQLTDFLGGENVAGSQMKSTSGWAENGNGTNESGFSGLPGGTRGYAGTFHSIGKYGSWWSSTEYIAGSAWSRYLIYRSGDVARINYGKAVGLSVRCLRD